MTTAFKIVLACMVGVFFFNLQGFAQRKVFKINPGENMLAVLPHDEVYSYETFTDGAVYLKDNRVSTAKLNYNALFGDMQFIDANGDTLSIADENNIRFVVVKNDTFLFDNGYLRLVSDINGCKLARRKFFSFSNKQKVGGFGELSSASIDTYDRISTAGTFNTLVPNTVVTLSLHNLLYIGDKFNRFKLVNKKNLADIFAKNQNLLQQYVKQNNVDFTSEEDVRKLVLFMQDGQAVAQ